MTRKKKAFIGLIISAVVVLLVGTISTTYAWFLSRYSKEYSFVLDSESAVIIKYESELSYDAGSGDVLVPAEAKQTIGIEQEALAPMDMFDTMKIETVANDIRFVADGAYWTGTGSIVGRFYPSLNAYLASFVTAQSITEDTLQADIAAGVKPLAANDLVAGGELDYFMIFDYLNKKILYYDGNYYFVGEEPGADLTLPAAAEGDDDLRYWHILTTESVITYKTQSVSIYDGTYLLLQPNTTFTYKLYVFVAKTDEELDPAFNGQTIDIFATLNLANGNS